MKEKAEKKAMEEKKRLEKEAKKAEAAAKAAALEAAKRLPPSEMFKVIQLLESYIHGIQFFVSPLFKRERKLKYDKRAEN